MLRKIPREQKKGKVREVIRKKRRLLSKSLSHVSNERRKVHKF